MISSYHYLQTTIWDVWG